jgi:coenzyme PQQ precursor peptide PqqA
MRTGTNIREIGQAECPLAILSSAVSVFRTATRRPGERRSEMTRRTPKIIEVPVGMEINMYACAARK